MTLLSYRRHRFPPEIIQHAIWLYLRFTLSYRDVEELLAERGVDVSYETVWPKSGPANVPSYWRQPRRSWRALRPACNGHAVRCAAPRRSARRLGRCWDDAT